MATCNNNGVTTRLEVERRDLLKIVGSILATAAILFGGAMYIFQTRAQAIAEHARIELNVALQDLRGELERRHLKEKITDADSEITKAQKILMTLDANQRELMKDLEIPKWRTKPLPAGLKLDFEESE